MKRLVNFVSLSCQMDKFSRYSIRFSFLFMGKVGILLPLLPYHTLASMNVQTFKPLRQNMERRWENRKAPSNKRQHKGTQISISLPGFESAIEMFEHLRPATRIRILYLSSRIRNQTGCKSEFVNFRQLNLLHGMMHLLTFSITIQELY
jgi:hypothetical protein